MNIKMNGLRHEIILYLDVKTILKHFEFFSNEDLIYWMNEFSDEEWKKLDLRELWRKIRQQNEPFLIKYFTKMDQIYDSVEKMKHIQKLLNFFIKYEKIIILNILVKWKNQIMDLWIHQHIWRWMEDAIQKKSSENFINELILIQKECIGGDLRIEILSLLLQNGYIHLFYKYYPNEKEKRDEIFMEYRRRRGLPTSHFFQNILSNTLFRPNSIEKKRDILRTIYHKMELEEGDLNLHESYYSIMQLLEIEEDGLFHQLQLGNILLPDTFVTDFLKSHWNRSTLEVPTSHLHLLDFILNKMEKRPQFQYPEDDKLNSDIQDNMYMILKIYKDGPSKENALKIFEFFVSLYHTQLFKVFENEEKKKSFRFVDSIVDFMICHNLFEGIPILQNLGYQMKMEHYLFVMTKYKEDLSRISALYDLGTPLSDVVIEYAATFGYFHLVKFYHEKGCPWNSKTLYGACKSLNLELVEYCFKEKCDWDPRTLYLFNPYFSKQALEREDLNVYREKIQHIFEIIKKYTPPIELKVENESNENDIKKKEENEEEN